MSGDWGSWIVQFAITVVVVLALIAVVYWLVRRYSSGGLGRIGRGRVPRLAIVDAMPVDGRRRLVLVRRDNTEHLILIGGPSDLVVEAAIQRPRQRPAARPQTAGPQGAVQAAAPEPVATPEPVPAAAVANPPIPFPATGRMHAQGGATPSGNDRNPTHSPRRNIAQSAQAAAAVQFDEAIATAPLFPELPALPGDHEAGNSQSRPDFVAESAPPPNPFATPQPATDPDTAAKVNDLEREMARLLGEITAKPVQ
jgi:flagellar biogenesis protein FliO